MSADKHSVRLIGGTCRRSRLPVLPLEGLRPTPDRVRVTLFNWLGVDLSGWRCLDAFAGTGALGLEAASRGAAQVVLLETQWQAVHSLRSSLERLKLEQVRIEKIDALQYFRRAAPASWELVFLDPPFGDDALRLAALQAAVPLVVQQGLIYLESPGLLAETDLPEGLVIHRQARAGAVHFQLLRVIGSLES